MRHLERIDRPDSPVSIRWGVVVLAAAIAAAGCGLLDQEEEEPPPPKPPEFGSPSIECSNPDGDDIDREVITEVAVRVTDEKRDLVTRDGGALCGTLDGIPIALYDDDADQVFTWTNSTAEAKGETCRGEVSLKKNRMICEGDFLLKITATDKAGNTTELEEVISKGSSS